MYWCIGMTGNLTYQVPEVPGQHAPEAVEKMARLLGHETAQEDYPQMILGPPHNGRVPIYADKASQNIGLVAVWLREVA